MTDHTPDSTPKADNTPPTIPENDGLMVRLAAANPVPAAEVESADSTRADAILARVTSRPGEFAPYGTTGGTSERRSPATISSSPPRQRLRWPALAAVAAVALLFGLVAVVPGTTEPALATVQAAADVTADASTGRVISTFQLDSVDGNESGILAGTATTEFNGENVAATIDVDDGQTTAMSAQEIAQLELVSTRLVDGIWYFSLDGKEWFKAEAPAMVSRQIGQMTDLRSLLDQVGTLVEVEEVGTIAIDGLSATHYRSEVDLAEQRQQESAWMPAGQAMDIEPVGLVTIDLYVTDDGLMRRIEVAGDISDGESSDLDSDSLNAATFSVVTDFVDLGSDISIEAPDDAVDIEGLQD